MHFFKFSEIQSPLSVLSKFANYSKNLGCMLKVSPSSSVSTFRNSQFYLQLCQIWFVLTGICKSRKLATEGKIFQRLVIVTTSNKNNLSAV